MYAANRHLVLPSLPLSRVLVVLALLMLAFLGGCRLDKNSSTPAPILKQPPYSYEGRIGRVWGGDNFEVVHQGKLHYAYIRGIDTPEAGQPFFHEAEDKLKQLGRKRRAIINVVGRDALKREICDVTIRDPGDGKTYDLALELVRSGLAWHDLNEEPWAKRFQEAEAQARQEKIGIWSQANPTPPWEFWEQQVQHIQKENAQ